MVETPTITSKAAYTPILKRAGSHSFLKRKFNGQQKPNGINKELKLDDAVIAKIVGITCNEAEGVYSLEGGMMANLPDMFSKDQHQPKALTLI